MTKLILRRGGFEEGRLLFSEDPFEQTVERCLGEWVRQSESAGVDLWSALTNIEWYHEDGTRIGYSYRAAGDLVAALRGEGQYLDWYCSGPAGKVSVFIQDVMAAQGWSWRRPSIAGV